MRDWNGRREPVWVHHGRRDGSWEDAAVHSLAMDVAQTVPASREDDDRERYNSVSLEFGQELGE